MNKPPKLTANRFDALLARRAPHTHAREGNIIWTAAAIGRRINRSATYVRRTLAKKPGSPVKQQGNGNLYAEEAELLEFMRKSA